MTNSVHSSKIQENIPSPRCIYCCKPHHHRQLISLLCYFAYAHPELCTDLASGIYKSCPQGGDPGLREGRACSESTEK